MSKSPDFSNVNRTPFATLSLQASSILRGPSYINIPNLDNETFYGWSVLCLEIRPRKDYRIESRIVYANLLDTTQNFGILRAVSWEGEEAKKIVKERKEKLNLTLPARFVKIPIEKLEKWLSELDNLQIHINEPFRDNYDGKILKLRLEVDYLSCIFEKVWQTADVKKDLLSQKWDFIWSDMTESLINSVTVAKPIENIQLTNFEFEYDFPSYQPNKIVGNR